MSTSTRLRARCGLAAAMAYAAVLSLLVLTMATLVGRVRLALRLCALRPGPPRFDLARGL